MEWTGKPVSEAGRIKKPRIVSKGAFTESKGGLQEKGEESKM